VFKQHHLQGVQNDKITCYVKTPSLLC